MARDDQTRLRQALLQLAAAEDEGVLASEQENYGAPKPLVGVTRYATLERLEARGLAERVTDRYMGRTQRVEERFLITPAGWSALQVGSLSRVEEATASA